MIGASAVAAGARAGVQVRLPSPLRYFSPIPARCRRRGASANSWAGFILHKMIRLAKVHRITSIADFVASRFGKSQLLGGLVTVLRAGSGEYLAVLVNTRADALGAGNFYTAGSWG